MVEKTEKLENIFRAETLRRSNDGEKEKKRKISLRRTKIYGGNK